MADDYASMARLARSMLEAGKSNEEILRACYGVPFPAEALVLAEMILDDAEPPVSFLTRPWALLTPLAQGGPRAEAGLWDEYQQRITQLDPTLIGLVRLYDGGRHGGQLLCYRRAELAAGRPTIFGLPEELPDGSVAEREGDSLGLVLREHQEDRVRSAEAEYASPSNRGAGSIDAEEVEGTHQGLVRIDDLLTLTAEREAGRVRSKSELPWNQRSRARGLIAAAETGDVPRLRELIAQGAVLDPPPGEESALFAAIENSKVAAVRFLLEAGADLHHRGRYSGLGPLVRACRNSSLEMIGLVLDSGASLKEWDAISAALHRSDKKLGPQILSLLVTRGIDANAQCTSATILMAACKHGDLESARVLLDRGADPNFRHFYGTALTVAEENGHQVLVDLLLDRGAKPDRPVIAPDPEGDARWKAARDQPRDPQARSGWAEALLRRGMRAAAARELEAAQKLGATGLEAPSLENPPGTGWSFAPFGAVIDDVTAPIEDARFPGATLTSGSLKLPLAVLLGPPCTTCDDKGQVVCSECSGTGVGDNYLTGGTFKCEPRMTCASCRGLKYVVRSRVYGKGPCRHATKKAEQPLPATQSSTFRIELTLNRCADCGLPALNDEFACGVCGFFVCRCAH